MVRILSSRFDALFEAELDFSCYRMIAGKGIMHAEVSSIKINCREGNLRQHGANFFRFPPDARSHSRRVQPYRSSALDRSAESRKNERASVPGAEVNGSELF